MELTEAFFQLQLSFAEKVAQVTQLPLEEALLAYTTFYLSFELERTFDPAHPIWQAYLQGLKHAPDWAHWTYTVYQQRRTVFTADFYGCFYYGYLPDEQAIRIHFINRETTEHSALSQARRVVRVQELARMFRAIQATLPRPKRCEEAPGSIISTPTSVCSRLSMCALRSQLMMSSHFWRSGDSF